MEKTRKNKKLLTIEFLYDKYKRKKGKLKRHLILGNTKFDLDPKYDIIDLGIF